jgi:deoxyribonuclease V
MDDQSWDWPLVPESLEALQRDLAAAADREAPWTPETAWRPEPVDHRQTAGGADPPAWAAGLTVAATFAAFPRGEGGPGRAGQRVTVAAVVWRDGMLLEERVVDGSSGGPYVAGLLALRCGSLLEDAVGGLALRPDLLLIDATGRDHPRRAGLALHLGARLGLPSIGVTNRALVAGYDDPDAPRGSSSPLLLGDGLVGYAVRTRAHARPVLAHAAWRTTPEVARDVVLALSRRWRTPRPLRSARTLARTRRARTERA